MVVKTKKNKGKDWYNKRQTLTEFVNQLAEHYLKSGPDIICKIPEEVCNKRRVELAEKHQSYGQSVSAYINSPTLTLNEYIEDRQLVERKGASFIRKSAENFLQHGWAYLDELPDRKHTLLLYSWAYIRNGSSVDRLVSQYGEQVLSQPDDYLLSTFLRSPRSTDLGFGLNAVVMTSEEEMMSMARYL